MQPIRDRVLVRLVRREGVLWVGEDDGPREGVVVSHGQGKRSETGKRLRMTVREGDRVLFPAAVGQAIAGEKDLLVMNEDDILAVIED